MSLTTVTEPWVGMATSAKVSGSLSESVACKAALTASSSCAVNAISVAVGAEFFFMMEIDTTASLESEVPSLALKMKVSVPNTPTFGT